MKIFCFIVLANCFVLNSRKIKFDDVLYVFYQTTLFVEQHPIKQLIEEDLKNNNIISKLYNPNMFKTDLTTYKNKSYEIIKNINNNVLKTYLTNVINSLDNRQNKLKNVDNRDLQFLENNLNINNKKIDKNIVNLINKDIKSIYNYYIIIYKYYDEQINIIDYKSKVVEEIDYIINKNKNNIYSELTTEEVKIYLTYIKQLVKSITLTNPAIYPLIYPY